MHGSQRTVFGVSHIRRFIAPAMAVAAIVLTAQSALAVVNTEQKKPEMKVEAERSSQGARLTFKGKYWAPNARVKIMGTRAPGSNGVQDFGMVSADSAGEISLRKVAACSTTRQEDGQNEPVTFTSTDSATGFKVTTKVQGGAWVCI